MLRVKICGVTRVGDALRAAELGADAVGFIFYSRSLRAVSPARAARIAKELPAHVARVGVFVDHEPETIHEYVQEIGLDAVQYHGNYRETQIARIANCAAIKAIRMHADVDLAQYNALAGKVDAFLLDTYHPEKFGGTGRTFDWHEAKRLRTLGRIILAGGLTPANIVAAVERVQPYAVDVNSGVECAPGVKDEKKLAALFLNIERFRHDWQPANNPRFPFA